jgi:hypothetical protein
MQPAVTWIFPTSRHSETSVIEKIVVPGAQSGDEFHGLGKASANRVRTERRWEAACPQRRNGGG